MDQERINRNVSELSQKLLEGCKLLSDSCPETNVPLVLTLDGRIYSVGNGAYYERDETGQLLVAGAEKAGGACVSPVPKPHSVGASSAARTPRSSPPVAADTTGTSLSAMVAEKLLEGYTLLSESCPVTNVPLVQSPDGRIFSVGTSTWYERRGTSVVEVRGKSQPGGPAWNASPADSLTASSVHSFPSASRGCDRDSAALASAASGSQHRGAACDNSRANSHAAALQSAAAAAAAAAAVSAAPASDVLQSELTAVRDVLTEKLAQARIALSRANGVDEVAPLVALVKEIASAIGVLRAV